MRNEWATADAEAVVAHYPTMARDLALRVYPTRLLGRNPKLVLHGGGNTSVKLHGVDLNGDEADVLCVKGSGWDMGTIEPAGLPAVRLAPPVKIPPAGKTFPEGKGRPPRGQLFPPPAPETPCRALLAAVIPPQINSPTPSTAGALPT